MPEDWGADEHRHMVCVESGNVKQNKTSLAPGTEMVLTVKLSTRATG
jgi:D-hexose-6-phosphate mutarotase